jgi:hypothetical protein
LPFFESRIQQCVRDFFCPIPKGILGIVTFAITKKGNPTGSLFLKLFLVINRVNLLKRNYNLRKKIRIGSWIGTRIP